MLDLRHKRLVDCIVFNGIQYKLKTDFRVWLDFDDLLNQPFEEVDLGFYFDGLAPENDWINLYSELSKFHANPNSTPKSSGASNTRLYDFIEDGEYIYSSFLYAYNIDLIDIEYLHWHKFLALFRSLPEDTKIKEIMGFRNYKYTNKKQEALMKEAKNAWKLPIKTNYDEKAALEQINNEFYGC